MAAQWELTSGPRGNGEREKEEGERASEKPNQQLLLIMDWTLIQWENKHSDDVSGFYFNKNL